MLAFTARCCVFVFSGFNICSRRIKYRSQPSLLPSLCMCRSYLGSHSDASPSPFHEAGPTDVLYFAYGSNMSPTVMSGRRGVMPKVSKAAILEGYTLSFRLPVSSNNALITRGCLLTI